MRTGKIVIGALASILPLAMLFMAGASDSLAASPGFGTPSKGAPMLLGASVPAPSGFVAFCERSPEECPRAPVVAAPPFLPGVVPFEPADDRFYRADADSAPLIAPLSVSIERVQPASAPAASGPRFGRSRGTDWSGLFAAARLEHAAPAPARPGLATSAIPLPGLAMTSEVWSIVTRVNKQVNKAIIFREDDRTWGASDYWALPLENGVRSGDCEDYVLEKRRALQAEGVPKEALSIALVITPWGESHAVLLVATQKGEMVLDNLSPWIVPWSETGYRWLTRQAPGGDAMTWVSIASIGA
jgi:predicted transglutaminase-like cysteine proteinase